VVIWTPLAQEDLKNIHDHIAKDAPSTAKKVTTDLVHQTHAVLALSPDGMGKKVPELNREDVREIHVHSWRVIYHVQKNRKMIITLFHVRRELMPSNIPLPQ
jgi:toxin ParE1/3/4